VVVTVRDDDRWLRWRDVGFTCVEKSQLHLERWASVRCPHVCSTRSTNDCVAVGKVGADALASKSAIGRPVNVGLLSFPRTNRNAAGRGTAREARRTSRVQARGPRRSGPLVQWCGPCPISRQEWSRTRVDQRQPRPAIHFGGQRPASDCRISRALSLSRPRALTCVPGRRHIGITGPPPKSSFGEGAKPVAARRICEQVTVKPNGPAP